MPERSVWDLPILGASEVAEALGWDRRRVAVYHGRGALPAPLAQLASGPVWRREDILRYAAERGIECPSVVDDNEPSTDPARIAEFEAEVQQLRAELAEIRKKESDRRHRRAEPAEESGLDLAVRTLLDVGVRLAQALDAVDGTPWPDELHRADLLADGVVLAVQRVIRRLLGYRQEAWPDGTQELLNEALALLWDVQAPVPVERRTQFRVHRGRLQCRHASDDRWRDVVL